MLPFPCMEKTGNNSVVTAYSGGLNLKGKS